MAVSDAPDPETASAPDAASVASSQVPPVEAATPVPRWLGRTFESLRERNFLLLWLGVMFSMGGFQMQSVARAILAYDLTGDPLITGVVGVAWAPSLVLGSLAGGIIGDRFDRRRVMLTSLLGYTLITGAITGLIFAGVLHWAHLIAASFVQGGMFSISMPARQAAVPGLVGPRRTSNAFALTGLAATLMTMVGPALGGIIYDTAGPGGAYVGVGILMIASFGCTWFLPALRPDRASIAGTSRFEQMFGGFSYVFRNRSAALILLHIIGVGLFATAVRMLINIPAEEIYGVTARGVGVLVAASGLGGIISSAFIAGLRPGQRRGMFLLSSAVFAGAALLILAASSQYVMALFAMLLLGVGDLAPRTLGQAMVIETTPVELRARVTSVIMISITSIAVGQLALGALMRAIGVRPSLWVFAVLLVLTTLGFLTFARTIRQLR